jgi:hypothetical protein
MATLEDRLMLERISILRMPVVMAAEELVPTGE